MFSLSFNLIIFIRLLIYF